MSTGPRGNVILLLMLRVVLLFVLVGGLAVAVGWFVLMPKGFPIGHVRFWANNVLPGAAVIVFLSGIVAGFAGYQRILVGVTFALAGTVLFGGVAGKILFPISVSGIVFVLVLFGCGAAVVIPALITALTPPDQRVRTSAAAMCFLGGAVLGVFIPWSQQSSVSATTPYSPSPLPEVSADQEPVDDLYKLRASLGNGFTIYPASGDVDWIANKVSLSLSPLLTFVSSSPDRCWTLFAPSSARTGPERRLLGVYRQSSDIVSMDYEDDGRSRLAVEKLSAGGVRLEAQSYLPDPVYSHLNSFCQLQIMGEGPLALAFSPCEESVIEIKESDYPFGRPIRLAYLGRDNMFRVVEASNGEKGPFTTLAEGPLTPDDPLTISIYAGGAKVSRVTLDGWASQASTQLSPTAGWGLPENAIEFSAQPGVGSYQHAVVFFTLSGTSIGRGFDSVGHAAGTYRSEILIEPVGEGSSSF